MSDSVILDIRSWVSSVSAGRKHLLDIAPQFTAETSYKYENKVIGVGGTITVTCGKTFTYIYADKAITYSINSGTALTGQLVMLTTSTLGSSILVTGLTASTTVMVITVS